MAQYALSSLLAGTQQAFTTTYKTLVGLSAATGATTLRRLYLYDVEFGLDAAPDDHVILMSIERFTAIGTGTTVTPTKLDAADAASLATARANHTAEPTYPSSPREVLKEIPINQRTTYRWACMPESGLVVPSVDANGIGVRGRGITAGYTGTGVATILFQE